MEMFKEVAFKDFNSTIHTFEIVGEKSLENLRQFHDHSQGTIPYTIAKIKDKDGNILKLLIQHQSLANKTELHPMAASADIIICCYPAFAPVELKNKVLCNFHHLRMGTKITEDNKLFVQTLNSGRVPTSIIQ